MVAVRFDPDTSIVAPPDWASFPSRVSVRSIGPDSFEVAARLCVSSTDGSGGGVGLGVAAALHAVKVLATTTAAASSDPARRGFGRCISRVLAAGAAGVVPARGYCATRTPRVKCSVGVGTARGGCLESSTPGPWHPQVADRTDAGTAADLLDARVSSSPGIPVRWRVPVRRGRLDQEAPAQS